MRRRAGDSILIGDGIEVHVIETATGRVKLGISAPAHVAVVRGEVKATRDANVRAAVLLTPERIAQFAAGLGIKNLQAGGGCTDMSSDGRRAGHPIAKGNPDPAGCRDDHHRT
ncbi:MAG TPA: carbon storage regulator [Bryobacteraceae bacterium]|nr:carbon storage regulator [Bryobacteraceae bacterium]